jgi:hypothetical protein
MVNVMLMSLFLRLTSAILACLVYALMHCEAVRGILILPIRRLQDVQASVRGTTIVTFWHVSHSELVRAQDPILKSRAVGCTQKELEVGEARTVQLLATAKSFVLRRDASILENYLPPKCVRMRFLVELLLTF